MNNMLEWDHGKYCNSVVFRRKFSKELLSLNHVAFLKKVCSNWKYMAMNSRSSRSEVFLVKSVLKICSKFTGEHPCRSVISINFRSNFIEITLWHGCSTVNLLHIFRTPSLRTPLDGYFWKSSKMMLNQMWITPTWLPL